MALFLQGDVPTDGYEYILTKQRIKNQEILLYPRPFSSGVNLPFIN